MRRREVVRLVGAAAIWPLAARAQQATEFTFNVNLRTAKTLRLAIPQTLLATANDVIE